MKIRLLLAATLALSATSLPASELSDAIQQDYDDYLWPLFDHFHRNPELSLVEFETATRMAEELRAAGFEVTENVGGTGVVAIMENGPGPYVMMRADMDGLPVEEKSGLENASTKQQTDPITGNTVFTMHACGHDVHITSLVGTARQMAERRDTWSGTLVLIGQPAEERISGARRMLEDGLYERFPKPDYALAFHVSADGPAGKVTVPQDVVASSSDSVDIVVHGVGAHGASPHRGVDPVLVVEIDVVSSQSRKTRLKSNADRCQLLLGIDLFHDYDLFTS